MILCLCLLVNLPSEDIPSAHPTAPHSPTLTPQTVPPFEHVEPSERKRYYDIEGLPPPPEPEQVPEYHGIPRRLRPHEHRRYDPRHEYYRWEG